jgi:hypothetical protein
MNECLNPNIKLRNNDMIVIKSALFEDNTIVYYDIAYYHHLNNDKKHHNIVLLLNFGKRLKYRKIEIAVTQEEIFDFVFSNIR